MRPAQTAALVDSAFCHPRPLDFVDVAVTTPQLAGRIIDGATAARIGCRFSKGEIDVLMHLSAAWARGGDWAPAEAAWRFAKCGV